MHKNKIILVGNTAWGMHQFRGDLMRELISRGHRVLVVSPKDDYVKNLTDIGVNHIDLPLDRKSLNPFKDILLTLKLMRIFLEYKPDLVLNYTIKPALYGSLAAFMVGVPKRIAITTGLGYAFAQETIITFLASLVAKLCLKFASEAWFLNTDDQNFFINKGLVAAEKTVVIPGEGVDINFYSSKKMRPQVTRFAFVGRMLWDKGVGVFVEVAKELKKIQPELEFLLVGPSDEGNPEGIPLKQLEEWNASGDVLYLGPKQNVKDILEQIECLIHPAFYREGIPRIILEANSMGIPCITTDIPGCRDVVIDGINGYIVRPKDKNALKESILKFISLDSSIKADISLRSRERITRKFSSDIVHKIYFERLGL